MKINIFSITGIFLLLQFSTHAQINFVENERLGRELAHNLSSYSAGYTKPVLENFGASSASGMFLHTRNKDKKWQSSISIFVATTFLNETSRTMHFDDLNLESTELENPENRQLPTVVGFESNNHFKYYPRDENGNRVSTLLASDEVHARLPVFRGAGFQPNIIPSLGLQSRLTYNGKTSLQFRYLPVPEYEGVQTFSGGLGISQVVFDDKEKLRVLAVYQTNYWNNRMQLEFEDGEGGKVEGEGQEARFSSQIHALQIQSTYGVGRAHFFAGAGMLYLQNQFSILGTYEFDFNAYGGPGGLLSQEIQFVVENPVFLQESRWLPTAEIGVSFDFGSLFIQSGFAYQTRPSVFFSAGLFL